MSTAPSTAEEVAQVLAQACSVRPVGGATKLDWGGAGPEPEVDLSTARLDAIVEHNAGDLTAVLQAGVPLGRAQEAFARHGQRLSLDPPDGGATIGGVVASGDSGPLRHRHGAPRDLILGVLVALPDGTVARAGSKVIKNVAGYDLAKLQCGALGTLGVVCEVTVRLHPRPARTATAVGTAVDPATLGRAAITLARRPLELESLDLSWDGPALGGALMARAVGPTAPAAARAIAQIMGEEGLAPRVVQEGDEELWESQRARQRAGEREAIVRVSALPATLPAVLAAAPSAVARAGVGLAWVRIDAEPAALAALRARLPGVACVLQDAPAAMRAAVDAWGVAPGPELELMRRVKLRFDPGGVCNPGRFVSGL